MKKILVTGGAGFIGSHLSDLLIKNGYQVTCVDDLITGSKKNIEHLLDNKNFKFIEADVTNPLNLDVDYIFHLASPASPVGYLKNPEETLLVNSVGTLNILNLAKNKKTRVLIASTSEIYGDPKEHPQKETYWGNVNSFGPRACYDESKRFAEAAAYVFIRKYKVDARIVRIFNTYGPKMQKDDGRVVSNLINQALTGGPLTVYGNGTQTRSFCYVSDLVDGIFKFMFKDDLSGEVINLGNPEEYKVIDLAKKIQVLTGVKSQIVFKSLPVDDPKQRRPDISKARKMLNWEPKVGLDEGLKKTIEYYKGLVIND